MTLKIKNSTEGLKIEQTQINRGVVSCRLKKAHRIKQEEKLCPTQKKSIEDTYSENVQ